MPKNKNLSRSRVEERKANRPKEEAVHFGTLIDFLKLAKQLITIIKTKLQEKEIKPDLSDEEIAIHITQLIKNELPELRTIFAKKYINIDQSLTGEWIFGVDVFHWIWEHSSLGDRTTHSKAIHYNPASHYEKGLPGIDSREQHTRHGVLEGKPNLNELFNANKLNDILVGATLSGGDEEGDLQFSLRRNNFSGLNCSYADFRYSLLENSLFNHCKAKAAIFKNAVLESAQFEKADLERADFSSVYAPQTNFAEANLDNSNMSHALLIHGCFRKVAANNVDFTEAHLNETDLNEATLTHVNLQSAKLSHAKISGAHFSNSNLQGAECKNLASETSVNFENCDLREANFLRSKLGQANFFGADLTNTTMEFVTGEGCNFNNAKMVRTNLHDAHFLKSSFINIDAHSSHFEGTYLTDSKLSHVNFTDSVLKCSCLLRCELSSVDFTNADLTEANLCSTKLQDVNLKNANLYHARLYNVEGLTPRTLSKAKNLKDIIVYVHQDQFYTYDELISLRKKPTIFTKKNQEMMDLIATALKIQQSKKEKMLSSQIRPKAKIPDANKTSSTDEKKSNPDLDANIVAIKRSLVTEEAHSEKSKKELSKDAPVFQPRFSVVAKLNATTEEAAAEPVIAKPKKPKAPSVISATRDEPISAPPAKKAPPAHGWLKSKNTGKLTLAPDGSSIPVAVAIPLEVEEIKGIKPSHPKPKKKPAKVTLINDTEWCNKQVTKIFKDLNNHCADKKIQLQRTEHDQLKTLVKDFFMVNITALREMDLQVLSKIRDEIFERIQKALYGKSSLQFLMPYNWQSTHGIRLNLQTHPENGLDLNVLNLIIKNYLESKDTFQLTI